MASSGRAIVLGALLAGLAVGVRTQTFWITVPLLLLVLADRIGRGVAGAMLGSGIAFVAGVLAWAVPLVVASGGPQAYLAALGSQAGEDFAGVEMLYLNPAPRLAAFALLRTFVWPWDSVPLAAVVLMLAAVGLFLLLAGERRTLAAVAVITAPYLVFHLAFQDTTFARYALPVVWPVAFLAAVALDAAGRVGALAAVGLAAWSLSVAVPQLSAYVERGSPTARLFDRVTEAAATASPAPVVAMHQALLRPLEAEPRPVGERLPAPPRREWLELARHWQSGAAGPVWFLADARRTDLALIDPSGAAPGRALRVGTLERVDAGGDASRRRAVVPPRRARMVRHRGLEPHARDRGHGPPDGKGAAPGPHPCLRAPAAGGQPRAGRRSQSRRRGIGRRPTSPSPSTGRCSTRGRSRPGSSCAR